MFESQLLANEGAAERIFSEPYNAYLCFNAGPAVLLRFFDSDIDARELFRLLVGQNVNSAINAGIDLLRRLLGNLIIRLPFDENN